MPLMDSLVAEPAPLLADEDGTVRVRGTRVRLDTIIFAYHQGCSPEEICLKYPSVSLTDVYAIITYYLWHKKDVDAYLAERERLAATVRKENEARFPNAGIRERLLSRRTNPI